MDSYIQDVFLQKITSLRRCLQRRDIDDTIELSALLRFLLKEGNVDKVNRACKQKIRYQLGPEDNGFVFDFRISFDDQDIFSHAKHPGLDLDSPLGLGSLSQFLRHPILRVYDQHYTVDDVVKIVANKLGGVHMDERAIAQDKKVMFLNDLKRTWAGDVHALYDALRTIALNTLKALEPLESIVRGYDIRERGGSSDQ